MIERLRGNGHCVAHIALLAVALAEVPLVFQGIERLIELSAGKLRLELAALGLVGLAIGILDIGGVRQHGARRFQADAGHGFAEEGAIFCHVDGGRLGADHLDIITIEHAHALQRQRGVERRLAAHGRQQRIRALLGDDLGDDLRGDRLDIGRIRKTRVGHDRCRVGVDEDDAVAFLPERLAGLRARIVEFASLADNDRSCTDNEDRFDILALRHGLTSVFLLRKKPARVGDHRSGRMAIFSG